MGKEMFIIEGGSPFEGEVRISGSKNAALKHVVSSLLAQGKNTLYNIPDIADINVMGKLVENFGCKVWREGEVMYVDSSNADSWEAPYELVSKMRASITALGCLIARFGKARIAMPGGCNLGARKIDMHIMCLEALGVHFENDHGYLMATTPNGLHGASIVLDFPSVGATENTLMCAVCAEGETILENPAREPEIVDLANILNDMGGKIHGAGTSTIVIEGVPVSEMHTCTHTCIGDRIEAGTFLTGGALMGSPVTAKGIDPDFLRMAIMKWRAMGADVETGKDWITISRNRPLKPVEIQTLPHPGFPTDLQPMFMLLAAHAKGNSVITENIFENRFMFASEIGRMGANISIEGHHAFIQGVDHLQGASVRCTDLRCGAALAIAGVGADGVTEIHDLYHVDRGYENFAQKLTGLGVRVQRVPDPELDL